jgi:chromate transporter
VTGAAPQPPTLTEAVRVWTFVGLNSFGGPAGQISVMHRELVDDKRWLDEQRFAHALNFCLLLPGPEAQQLATYTGWLLNGVRGGLLAGSLFVLPGFLVMLVLAAVYARFGDVGWIGALLFGLQAAVVGLVLQAVVRMARRTLHTPLLGSLALLSFAALVADVPFPAVVLAAGLLGWLIGRTSPAALGPSPDADGAADDAVPPAAARAARRAAAVCLVLWLTPVVLLVALLGPDNIFAQQAVLFSQTAVVTFGGAYAVLAYVAQQAVQTLEWISADDMAAGLGLAETTPGPLILVLQFVGFLAAYQHPGALPPMLAGVLGAVLAVWVTFLPSFVFIFAGAPVVERLRHSTALRHGLSGIGAAVVGVIANLGLWLAVHVLFDSVDGIVPDPATLRWDAVAVVGLGLVLVLGRAARTPVVLAACAGAGLVLGLIGLPG